MSRKLNVAIVQDVPIPFAVEPGVRHAARLAERAAANGAQLIAFAETFLGGYPLWLDHAPKAALWDHPGTKQLHAILLEQALRGRDPRLKPLQRIADRTGALISIGGHERLRSSLFDTQYLFRPNAPPMLHRKLAPGHAERMIWGCGDGSTLTLDEAKWGSVGQLISGEHWMPLARAAMHHSAESVHVAAWPAVQDLHLMASCHYAYEGRCFVLAAGAVQDRQDLLDGLEMVGGNAAGRALLQSMPQGRLQHGGSAIVAPDGVVLARAGHEPEMLHQSIDLSEIEFNLATLDVDGHHARPDIFELIVDRRARQGLSDRPEDEGDSDCETQAA
ncbi:nitrilase-related carbon-nitrogen hydrolase [Sphingosinithalassobacter sp. CS137]|uniref:nitrilase-related carbon-nitrogen hydrolase n=1 Tax=Sphingosinithalassobacter sp. CS137 TaxID=2762748 RepID=UPI00165DD44C|nr:nitrilase-related carbon-nitrogen hydrolase [Sphingosinithalassobacter sp. CS137]